MGRVLYVIFALITFFSFAKNTDALSNIVLSEGTLSPYFNESTYKYNVYLNESVTEININATLDENDDYVDNIGNIKLSKGENEVKLMLYKKDGSSRLYTIKVFVGDIKTAQSALLKNLKIDGYDLKFDSSQFNYSLNIEGENELDIEYTPYDENASIKLSGNSNLKYGNNSIIITVISSDNETKNVYEIKVNKTKEVFKENEEYNEESYNYILNDKDKFIIKVVIVLINIFIIFTIFYLLFLRKSKKTRAKLK